MREEERGRKRRRDGEEQDIRIRREERELHI